MKPANIKRNSLLTVIAALLLVALQQYLEAPAPQVDTVSTPVPLDRDPVAGSWSAGQWISVEATVTRTLADDNEGSRHQRFIITLPDRRTLLVAHNIDLADRVPLRKGDRVSLRGRYEDNDRGGVVHWTHHDPDGDLAGGWIEHRGRRYR